MKRLMLLAVMALAACDPPLEETWPRKSFEFNRDGRLYDVTAQYDPFERAYFTRVSAFGEKLPEEEREIIGKVVEQRLANELCDSRMMQLRDGKVWTGFDATRIRHLPDLGAWQFVARCM